MSRHQVDPITVDPITIARITIARITVACIEAIIERFRTMECWTHLVMSHISAGPITKCRRIRAWRQITVNAISRAFARMISVSPACADPTTELFEGSRLVGVRLVRFGEHAKRCQPDPASQCGGSTN